MMYALRRTVTNPFTGLYAAHVMQCQQYLRAVQHCMLGVDATPYAGSPAAGVLEVTPAQ